MFLPQALAPSRDSWACWRRRLVPATVIALVLLSYLPLGNAGFIHLDDYGYVVGNPMIEQGVTLPAFLRAFTEVHSANWHPLTWISHMLDVQIYGLDPAGHHLTNLLLHVANVLLLAGVLFRMTGAFWMSWLVAALFALHPLNVETVAWVSERKNLLCTTFGFAAIFAYQEYARKPNGGRYAAVCALHLLGLMSKPMLVSLPLLLILLDVWPLRRLVLTDGAGVRSLRSMVNEKTPLLVLSAASCVVTILVQRAEGAVGTVASFPLGLRAGNAALSYVWYLTKALWPTRLGVYYPYPAKVDLWQAFLAAAVLLAAIGFALRLTASRPWLTVGWLWFLGTLVPVIGLVQVGGQARADRYFYLPGIGLFIALSWCVREAALRWKTARLAAAGALLCCVLALAWNTWHQAARWTDGVKLFRHTIAVTHRNYIAEDCLGNEFLSRGLYDSAEAHFSAAIAIEPRYEHAYYNRGLTRYYLRRADSALRDLEIAAQKMPQHGGVYQVMGWIHREAGRLGEATASFSRAVENDPQLASAHNDLGRELLREGKLPQAEAAITRALRLDPKLASAYVNLADVYQQQGMVERAIETYGAALRRFPRRWEFHNNLGLALAIAGRDRDAIRCFDAAAALAPSEALPRRNKDAALLRLQALGAPADSASGSPSHSPK